MDIADKCVISSLSSDTSEETWRSLLSLVQSWTDEIEDAANRHYSLLQKLNVVYKELTDVTHADALILLCCQALAVGYIKLNSKYLLNTAKVLSHLSVKVLEKGSHSVCMGCWNLLTQLVPEIQDLDCKERISITGYCYKSIWNKHSTPTTSHTIPPIAVYEQRIMALRLAAVSGLEKQISKYAQQVTVAVSSCPTTGEGQHQVREGLSQLKASVDASAGRPDSNRVLWSHLSLFINSLQCLHSVDYLSDMQTVADLPAHSALCQDILERYRLMVQGNFITELSGWNAVLDTASDPIELHSVSVLLHAACKLLHSQSLKGHSSQVLMSWVSVLVADIHTSRKMFELEEKSRSKHFQTRELACYYKLLQVCVEAVGRDGVDHDAMLSALEANNSIVRSLIAARPGCQLKPLADMGTNISRLLHHVGTSGQVTAKILEAVKQIGFGALEVLNRVGCVESMMLVRSHLCDLLVKQYAFVDALDSFNLFSTAPKSHWAALVTEWCKIKRRATTAAVPAVCSRVIGVDVFGGLANKDDVIWLLFKEFSEFSMKECNLSQLQVLTAEMRARSVTKVHKALYCLCQVELLVTISKNISGAQKYTEKGLELLKDDTSDFCNDLTAQFLTWSYIIGYQDRCCMMKVNDALIATDYKVAAGNVSTQNASHLPLDRAVSLWSRSTLDSLYSHTKTAHCLDIISNMFYLSSNVNKTVAACAVATELLPAASLPLSTRVLHIKALIQLGNVQKATDELDRICDESPCDDVTLVRAELNIYTGDTVEEAVQMLEAIVERQNKRSLEEVYTLATAQRLLLNLLINNPSAPMKSRLSDLAWNCQREHSTLLNSMVAYRLKTYGLRLQYLDAVLSSYITMAKVNLYVGSVRDCLCFLHTSQNMARLLHLPLREADISTTKASLACFLCDFSEARVCLMHTHSILTVKKKVLQQKLNPQLLSTPKAPKTHVTKLTSKNFSSGTKTEIFGFESDEDAGNESFTINDLQLSDDEDDEYQIPAHTKDTKDITASPSLKKLDNFEDDDYTDWAPYQHHGSCTCDCCSDFMLQLSHLRMLCVLCVYRLKSGMSEQAVSLARKTLVFCQALNSKCTAHGCVHPAELVTCHLHLMSCVMRGLTAMGSYKDMEHEWSSLSLLTTTAYHRLALHQISYIHLIPQIQQYSPVKVVQSNTVVGSTTKLMNEVSSPLRPVDTNRTTTANRSSLLKAPRKPGPITLIKHLQLAFDDSDSEENVVNSTRKSSRSTTSNSKSATKSRAPRLGSLTRAQSPLATRASRQKSAKKGSITVFCDESPEQKKQSKSRTGSQAVPAAGVQPIRSSNRGRTASREVMRSLSQSDANDYDVQHLSVPFSPLLEFDSPVPQVREGDSTPTLPASGEGDDSSIELLRGDRATAKVKNRKYSDAESMRSSVPTENTSPPQLLTSPSQELVSPSSTKCTADIHALIGDLTNIWKDIHSKAPYALYKSVCQALAVLHYRQCEHWLAAFYLCETLAITFNHKSNVVRAQKLHQQKKESTDIPVLHLPSSRSIQDFKSAVNALPAGCVTCTVSVVTLPGSNIQHLYLTRLERNQEPVIVPATNMSPQETWKEFEDILVASKDSMRETRKNAWWEKRREVDERLKVLLSKMQQELGVARTALLGSYSDSKSRQVVEKCTERVIKELPAHKRDTIPRSLIRMLVNGADSVTEKELSRFLLSRYSSLSEDLSDKLTNQIKEGVRVCIDTREPLVVCLDKEANSICWESMPYLWELAITRMPSVYAVQSCIQSLTQVQTVYTIGVDTSNTFYVLNPDDNLPSTQSLFEPILASKQSWRGIVGQKPTAKEYAEGLTDHDLFIFLGHGSGSKYLKPRDLSKLNCRAAVLLMGCSSGAFDSRGDMESAGIIYDYHIANCPSVMACLWDVTDKDIDRFTNSIISKLLMADGDDTRRLLDCVPAARRACKLPYLVGCASVVYGLVVSFRPNK